MQAVILAAGLGTRMRPLTYEKPKPMLEVAGKPILARMIEMLPEEVDEVILIVGYKSEMVSAYFGDAWGGRRIVYIEQKELTGTYGALSLAKSRLTPGERFMLLFADDIYGPEEFKRLLLHPRTVLVHEVEHPERFGILLVDEEGKIEDMEEKPEHPKSNLAVTGAYLLDHHIFEYEPELHSNGEYYLPPVIMKMIKDYPMHAERASLWVPIGYPEDLARAEEILAGQQVNQ